MTTVSAERVLTAAGWLDGAEVRFADGRIASINETDRPSDAAYLAPGFIDIQVNGFGGTDLATSPPGEWSKLTSQLASTGVTSWLPTLISRPLDAYAVWFEDITAFARDDHGSRVLGTHLEGPWLGDKPGAHADVAVGPINLNWCRSLPESVRIVTLGPERPGALEAIRHLQSRGIIAAAGHSNADHVIARAAFDAGVSLLTHCFNATTPMHHRSVGLTGAALARDDVYVSFIADGHHVHTDMLKIAIRAIGPERTILVSDSSAWEAGALGSTKIQLVEGAPRTAEGVLAGSCLTLDAAVRYVVERCDMSLEHALRSASTIPARLLGESDIGVIQPGYAADLVALDDTLEVRAVWQRGKQIA